MLAIGDYRAHAHVARVCAPAINPEAVRGIIERKACPGYAAYLGARPAASASFFLSLLLFGGILRWCCLGATGAALLNHVEGTSRDASHEAP